jgi:uncharacterized protein (TIGR03435 family)
MRNQTFQRTFPLAIAGIVALGAVIALRAQAPATDTKPPAFEVASVKRNTSVGDPFGIGFAPGGRFKATSVKLRQLIADAYSTAGPPLPDAQISGGPNWIDSDRFDIVAKAAEDTPSGPVGPGPAAAQQMRLMLRTLLAERFKLTVHHETRELPIYALVMARSDGKLGPAFHKTEADCVAALAARGNASPIPGGPFCGIRNGPGRLILSAVPMPVLATTLSRSVGRTVVDRTGLTGNFDGNLEWTPDQMPPTPPPGAPPLPPIDPNGPSIFTALQEQLGLKLESTKGPVDVLVIDHVEKPSED